MAEDIVDTVVAPGVVTNPGRRHGRPTIQGTRIAVEDVLYALAAGEPPERVAHSYRLSPEQIRHALAYAADLVHALVPPVTDDELDEMVSAGGGG
jgi:uncharacterized protein (DUF433 family)